MKFNAGYNKTYIQEHATIYWHYNYMKGLLMKAAWEKLCGQYFTLMQLCPGIHDHNMDLLVFLPSISDHSSIGNRLYLPHIFLLLV